MAPGRMGLDQAIAAAYREGSSRSFGWDGSDAVFDGDGRRFIVDVIGGRADSNELVTHDGWADTYIQVNGDAATATITEVGRVGFVFEDAWCRDIDVWPMGIPIDWPADSSIAVDVQASHAVDCVFLYRPADAPTTQLLEVEKGIDADADDGRLDPEYFADGWHFRLAVSGGTPATDELVTDDGGYASARIEMTEDVVTATITEVGQADFPLEDVVCWGRPDGGLLPYQWLSDTSISVDFPPRNGVHCWFISLSTGESVNPTPQPTVITPKPTLPSTDVLDRGAIATGESWRLILIAAAGLLATILVLTPSRARP